MCDATRKLKDLDRLCERFGGPVGDWPAQLAWLRRHIETNLSPDPVPNRAPEGRVLGRG